MRTSVPLSRCASISPLCPRFHRFILADTEHLHRKIADMSHRIRRLEDAVAILQSAVSDERHPLLSDELLKIKFGPEATDGRQVGVGPEDQAAKQSQSIDALGTLTLGDSGEVKYFGMSAGCEVRISPVIYRNTTNAY